MKKQIIKGSNEHQSEREFFKKKFKNEIKNLGPKSLELVIKKLNYLCLEYDPYQTDEIPQTVANILEEFSLWEYTSNPFDFTNIILQLLDIAEEKVKNSSSKVH